ncbi:MAG: phosphoadenylyl-sulfate reductase [Microcoleaceae cyanobacterium]
MKTLTLDSVILTNLVTANQTLSTLNATERVKWTALTFGKQLVLSTSFGIQSAVMLHLVTQVIPEIPVIWVDTGYLMPETYQFAEDLTKRLHLNLKVYQSPISPQQMEITYGKLWEKGNLPSLNLYDQIRKVEPMERALKDLGATAWLAGLRRHQTDFRSTLDLISLQEERYKILPILDWSSRDIYQYLMAHNLPYHPLFDQGYVTVGDWHSTRPLTFEDEHERDTRFQGLKQECGIHLEKAASL